jgi:glyoxalase family protein
MNKISGIHHITAIAGDARRNAQFYTRVLGLRLVKKTVNFDDPQTYHFYFGDETGTPGSILTFFPWARVRQGYNGAGMASDIGYSVPAGSLSFWEERLSRFNVKHTLQNERFGEPHLAFRDPDGLHIELIEPAGEDKRKPWQTDEIKADAATRGFYSTTLSLKSIQPTAEILTGVFGYQFLKQEKNRYRFVTDEPVHAGTIDLLELPDASRGLNAGGTIHHIAFRMKDDNMQAEIREKIAGLGLNPTPRINRNYFYSVYFREPGGVLFELATDSPGFTVDEPLSELGTHLKLPEQFEPARAEIEQVLPEI